MEKVKNVAQSAADKLAVMTSPFKHHVYQFHEGSAADIELLGSKGSHLCEMVRLDLKVPPGFIFSTKSCHELHSHSLDSRDKIKQIMLLQARSSMQDISKQTGTVFSKLEGKDALDDSFPLLVSVRSSSPISMPGVLDSVLNLGINDVIVLEMARLSENPRWAYDTYRLFVQSYGVVVLGVPISKYENILSAARAKRDVPRDCDLNVEELQQVVAEFKMITGVPANPWEQLINAVEAVFLSAYGPRATQYRDVHSLNEILGTAVIVQAMVYGNKNERSGCGVAVSRNPTTGAKQYYGEYLCCAAGTDIVNGVRTPLPLREMRKFHQIAYDKLLFTLETLENHFKDVQSIEFTVQDGELFVLQAGRTKRSAQAAVRVAVAMVQETLISEREALLRIEPQQMNYFLYPTVDPEFADPEAEHAKKCILGHGQPAAPGVVTGKVVFTSSEAEQCCAEGEKCILVTKDASVDRCSAPKGVSGILTLSGGLTSCTACVARQMNIPAVTAATLHLRCTDSSNHDGQKQSRDVHSRLDFAGGEGAARGGEGDGREDGNGKRSSAQNIELCSADEALVVKAGEVITIDGSTGVIYKDEVPTMPAGQNQLFSTLLTWADRHKKVSIAATVNSLEVAVYSCEMGADSIGMFQTEHMFTRPDCKELFQKMILLTGASETTAYCKQCLQKIYTLHREEFARLFAAADGKEVKIRLLDAPLSAFLPTPDSVNYEQDIGLLAEMAGLSFPQCDAKVRSLYESDPFFGVRGARLAVLYPEICTMQVTAIGSAIREAKTAGIAVSPSVLIPHCFTLHEVDALIAVVRNTSMLVAEDAHQAYTFLNLRIGVIVAVPSACMNAERIVATPGCDFVVFDTTELTEHMMGLSCEDTQNIVPSYVEHGILARDPFYELDVVSVGPMLQLAVRKYRETIKIKDIQVEACGTHCADPHSLRFLSHIGVQGVSVEPNQVPAAKLAAAQAATKDDKGM